MARSPVFKISIFFTVLTVLAAIAVGMAVRSSFQELCEVCVTFKGRTECREAWGRTKDDAVKTAQDNACGLLAGGMTDIISCSNTRPDRSVCEP